MQPDALLKGDKVAVIATAKNFHPQEINKAIKLIEEQDLRVIKGKNLYKQYHQFAGTDQERYEDLQWAINDPEIKAVFFARGGYGTNRIIDRIDFSPLQHFPKWFIGFSDLTIFHFHLQRLGFPSIHGPMPITFLKTGANESIQSLFRLLKQPSEPYEITFKSDSLNRAGEATGNVIGGNLSIINTLIGTASDFDFEGKILFLEDVGEYLYSIDRMMVHLRRAGKLRKLAGLIIGDFSDCKDNEIPFGKEYRQVILDAVSDFNYPVAFNFPGGHKPVNMPLFFGKRAHLNVSEDHSLIKYETYSL